MDKKVSELRRMRCRVHGEHPTVTPTHDGVKVTSCCDDFSKQVIDKYGELLQKEAMDSISKAFKKFGK